MSSSAIGCWAGPILSPENKTAKQERLFSPSEKNRASTQFRKVKSPNTRWDMLKPCFEYVIGFDGSISTSEMGTSLGEESRKMGLMLKSDGNGDEEPKRERCSVDRTGPLIDSCVSVTSTALGG